MRNEIEIERIRALKMFLKETKEGKFPGPENSSNLEKNAFTEFVKKIS